MRILNLGSGLFTACLAFGLTACNETKTVKDVFEIPAPQILREDRGPVTFSAWDSSPERSLDLQDSIDLSAGHPQRAVITSRCVRGTVTLKSTVTLDRPMMVKIFALLPGALYAESLTGAECGFEVNLYNGAGSNRIFQFAQTRLTENFPAAAELQFDQVKSTANSPQFITSLAQARDTMIRFPNYDRATIQLVCRDAEFNVLDFNQVAPLSSFDFTAVIPREGRAATVLETRPIQVCRALIRESGRLTGTSPLFQMRFLSNRMSVTLLPPNREAARRADYFAVLVPAINGGGQLHHSTVEISNPDQGDRHVRVQKSAGAVNQIIYLANLYGVFTAQGWLRVEGFIVTNAEVTEDADFYYFTLHAGGRVQATASVVGMKHAPRCAVVSALLYDDMVRGYGYQALDTMKIQEFTDEGEAMADLSTALAPTLLFTAYDNIPYATMTAYAPMASPCPW